MGHSFDSPPPPLLEAASRAFIPQHPEPALHSAKQTAEAEEGWSIETEVRLEVRP